MTHSMEHRPKPSEGPLEKELASLQEQVRVAFPDGLMSENFAPIRAAGMNLEVRVFSSRSDREVRLGLFVPGAQYSRKTVSVDRSGAVREIPEAVPDFDKLSIEPDFAGVENSTLARDTMKAVLERGK